MSPVTDDMQAYIRRRTTIDEHGCWIWQGATSNGYGKFNVKRDGRNDVRWAHRASYQAFVGPIPDGHDVDHRCRVPACCNPRHLEAVTHAENMARGKVATATHCKHGHPFDEANTTHLKRGGRRCRTCHRERERRRRQ